MFKKSNTDIIKIENNDTRCTLYFSDDTNKVVLMTMFDEEEHKKIIDNLEKIVTKNET